MFYSPTTDGFYAEWQDSIPSDGIPLTAEEYNHLLVGRASGKSLAVIGGLVTLSDPLPTPEDEYRLYEVAIQSHMDSAAKSAGYDDIKTVVTYAEEPAVTKFQSDGKAFRKWRSLVWDYAYEQLDLVLSEQRPKPAVEELLLELPALEPLV